ncbi:molybdate ABC transporter substrate-binding protein [Microbulbifer sp. Q7]|uniref:molybdate ABC transporter substrate-binding protein n=1 Tax=Microbulbifer sp. Q7 TaxID=1785091 RepID=UPI000AC15A2D|nr:molybdate ABC transporter substrate-binding protein [Microbulbifer sp. Q7]
MDRQLHTHRRRPLWGKRSMKARMVALVAGVLTMLSAAAAHSREVTIAVASNFTAPMQAIVARYEARSQQRIKLVFGSSGKIYAQIRYGAPFDAFFSADQEKPERLIDEGLAEPNSRITYAEGRLAVWSRHENLPENIEVLLKTAQFDRLALANPKLAPYGTAARQVLHNLQLDARTRSRWVQGENISQTYQFVASGNADLGFVALSQIMRDGEIVVGSAWVVPQSLHTPVRQDAVILTRAADNSVLADFWRYMQGAEVETLLASYGYARRQAATPSRKEDTYAE